MRQSPTAVSLPPEALPSASAGAAALPASPALAPETAAMPFSVCAEQEVLQDAATCAAEATAVDRAASSFGRLGTSRSDVSGAADASFAQQVCSQRAFHLPYSDSRGTSCNLYHKASGVRQQLSSAVAPPWLPT